MKKVITYGTYDLLHEGHIRLLKRAKELGDYLIVGVTSDDFDLTRGKINVQQPLMERLEAVRDTGLADKIIVEEYIGQKIDDIKRYDVDIFTVGSDWEGQFDYLKEYCDVVYLPRTEGVSSSELRAESRQVRLGIVSSGKPNVIRKYYIEAGYVNGLEISAICSNDFLSFDFLKNDRIVLTNDYDSILDHCDAVYICSEPELHYEQIKKALNKGKHIICESPVCISKEQCEEVVALAKRKGLVLADAIKTAYSMAYNRLLLLVKSGRIGKVVSIETTCTSLIDNLEIGYKGWNSIETWGPLALLPIFEIFGVDYNDMRMVSYNMPENNKFDLFTKIDFIYDESVATAKVGLGVKSEGDLVISGTKGYAYVPSPWWKMDYFEIRYENSNENKRYYYDLAGEGIRYELVAFVKMIVRATEKETTEENNKWLSNYYVPEDVSVAISNVMGNYYLDNRITINKDNK